MCTIFEASISEGLILFDWQKFLGEFEHVRLPNPIEVNRTIAVRLGSIDHVWIYTHVLNPLKGKHPKNYSIVDKVGREKLLARKSCFVQIQSSPHLSSNLQASEICSFLRAFLFRTRLQNSHFLTPKIPSHKARGRKEPEIVARSDRRN